MSWVCKKCGTTEVFYDEKRDDLVCKNCGNCGVDKMRLVVLSKDHDSERGTCEVCGLENAHLVLKCPRCGSKFCVENCREMADEKGLCSLCRSELHPPPRDGDNLNIKKWKKQNR